MPASSNAGGITYRWEGETLGGLREGGYLAYMKTSTFAAGLARLQRVVDRQSTAIMCAEALPVRCHRRFIARQMAARGYRVTHIVTRGKPGYVEPRRLILIQPRISAAPRRPAWASEPLAPRSPQVEGEATAPDRG